MSRNTLNFLIATGLIIVAVSLRVLPHPANFAPIAAVAIFGGAVLPRRIAIWTPLLAMALSDLVIGLHHLILATWGCYALIALVSSYWMKKPTVLKGAVMALVSSVFFFVVTNFAVWQWDQMYAHTWAGLVECYTMALPFFRNTVISDLIFTGALFAIYAIAKNLISHKLLNTQKA